LICWICGAGHRIEIRKTPAGQVIARLVIFPSTGRDEVGEALVHWSLIVLEASIADLRSQGYEVETGDVIVGEERP
jgi:hypothetical protein